MNVCNIEYTYEVKYINERGIGMKVINSCTIDNS